MVCVLKHQCYHVIMQWYCGITCCIFIFIRSSLESFSNKLTSIFEVYQPMALFIILNTYNFGFYLVSDSQSFKTSERYTGHIRLIVLIFATKWVYFIGKHPSIHFVSHFFLTRVAGVLDLIKAVIGWNTGKHPEEVRAPDMVLLKIPQERLPRKAAIAVKFFTQTMKCCTLNS